MRTYANDGYVVSGNRAFVVWRLDIDHAEWGTMNMTQVAGMEGRPHRAREVCVLVIPARREPIVPHQSSSL